MDRKQEIASAVSEIRIIEKEQGVTRESLGKIKERLIRLARPELFPASDFPPPAPGGKLKSCLGITGEELNRFYDRSPEGPPRPKGETVVKQGTGVCFLPDDLHSIQIQAPLVNFHMYGLALDQLHSREYYQAAESTWKVFPAHGDIREAR